MGDTGGKITQEENNGIDPTSFEENGFVQPLFENGRFKNPFSTFEDRTFSDVFKMIRSEDNSNIPRDTQVSGHRPSLT